MAEPYAAVDTEEGFGLKEDWEKVERVLEQVIPVYDRTNRFISFGTDLKMRRLGINFLSRSFDGKPFSVLDLGSGPGKMTSILKDQDSKAASLMVDALAPMMLVAKSRNRGAEGLISVYENLPFPDSSFEAAMAGFAIRDSRNLFKALSEISRVLSPRGRFLIVDLSKPNSRFKRAVVAFYWRVFAPMMAFLASGSKGLKFATLFTTYQRLPTNSELLEIARKSGFEVLDAKYSMMDGACILLLGKELRS